MRINHRALALLLCLGAAGVEATHAATIIVTLDSNWADYHEYTYTATDLTNHTAPTGPYIGTFTGGSFGAGQVYLFCLDFNVDTFIGQPYSGYLTYPTTPAEIESAYLENQVLQAGGYNANVQGVSGPAQMAIWYLMNPSSVNPAPFPVDQTTAALVTEAQNAYLSGAWTATMASAYPVWIPDVLTSSQRFGVMLGPRFSSADVAPEPGTACLGIGGVLLLLSWKLRAIGKGRRKAAC